MARGGADREGGKPKAFHGCSPQESWHTGPKPVDSDPGALQPSTWPKDIPLELRFQAYFQVVESGCWEWLASLRGRMQYGQIILSGKNIYAHRLSYELGVGPIPDGKQIDHLCRNPKCVNPEHLEPVEPRENTMRGFGPTAQNAKKTHCLRGHEYNEANTFLGRNGRSCRECRRLLRRKA